MTYQQPELNFQEAEILRDNGIAAAREGADFKIPNWSDQASDMLSRFLVMHPNRPFKAENVREWATLEGLPQPPHQRAWGAIIRKAAKEGLIEFCGYAKTSNPRAHCTPAGLWRKK